MKFELLSSQNSENIGCILWHTPFWGASQVGKTKLLSLSQLLASSALEQKTRLRKYKKFVPQNKLLATSHATLTHCHKSLLRHAWYKFWIIFNQPRQWIKPVRYIPLYNLLNRSAQIGKIHFVIVRVLAELRFQDTNTLMISAPVRKTNLLYIHNL